MTRALTAIIILAVLLTALTLTGCRRELINSDLTTRDYSVTDFDSVDIGSAFDVEISPSNTYSVELTAAENLINDHIKVEKVGKTLRITVEGLFVNIGDSSMEARITMPALNGVSVSGAVTGSALGFKSTADFKANISDASNFQLDLETGNFNAEISGASQVTAKVKCTGADIKQSDSSRLTLDMVTGSFKQDLSGASRTSGSLTSTSTNVTIADSSTLRLTGSGGDLTLTGSGASDITLVGFHVGNADINLSGATRADVDVNGTMNVVLTGASTLTYGGNPRLGTKIEISAGSQMKHR